MRIRNDLRDAEGEKIQYSRLWLEDYVADRIGALAKLFSWLGLGERIPFPILRLWHSYEQAQKSNPAHNQGERRRFGIMLCGERYNATCYSLLHCHSSCTGFSARGMSYKP